MSPKIVFLGLDRVCHFLVKSSFNLMQTRTDPKYTRNLSKGSAVKDGRKLVTYDFHKLYR